MRGGVRSRIRTCTEQGIFAKEQGICTREQRIFLAKSEVITG